MIDSFGFIADCLYRGVEEACDMHGRGGYDRLVSAGSGGPIRFEIYYREGPSERPITYELSIAKDSYGRPYVQEERLRQRRKGQKSGHPYSFLILSSGRGAAWAGEEGGVQSENGEQPSENEDATRVSVELTDNRMLGIATLGALKEHPRITRFRRFLQGWYLSYFTPDAARDLPLAGPQKHLDVHGDNIGNVVQYMEREHKARFRAILDRIAAKIPGVDRIDTKKTEDGRLLLRFHDKGFSHPFYVQQMSDGTLKLFAYYLLLEDPDPAPFICIEEPENGLYHKFLSDLAREFREHATGRRHTPQIFVTTHQPYFVDAVTPDETWILEKGADGFSVIRRASDDKMIVDLVEQEFPLGSLWYSDYMDPR